MLYGLIPFVPLSALALGTNALLLGALAALYQHHWIGLGVYFIGILPHGIFELPALILSCALGLLICRTGTEQTPQKGAMCPSCAACWTASASFYFFVAPLLLVAALVEAYVTPALLKLVM